MSLEMLGLGLDAVGSIFGYNQGKKNRKQAQAQFNSQMDESIQRRVADARKAGISPLAAIGTSLGAGPTVQAGGGGSSRNPLGALADKLGIIESNRASAKRDEAEAALMDSQRARLNQESVSRGKDAPAVTGNEDVISNEDMVPGPATYYSPEVKMSQRPGVAAGTHPSRIQLKDSDGNLFTLPNPDAGLDEVGQFEFILGLPGRMDKTFKKIFRQERELYYQNKELERLRRLRNNPAKVKEYNSLRAKMFNKARSLYHRYRKYIK